MPSRSERSLRQNSNETTDTLSSVDPYDDSPAHRGRYRRDRARDDEYSTSDRRRNRRLDSHESGRRHESEEERRKRERRRRRHEKDEDEAEDRQRRRERRERRARRRARKEAEACGEEKYIPIESPPPYDEKPRQPKDKDKDRPSPKRTASQDQDQGEEEQGTKPTNDRQLSKLERIGGPFIYIIPLLTAFCLLAASTCSADWWRKDVNVIRLGLPGDVYARLLATGNNLGKGGGEAVVDSGGKVQERAAKISPAGWLSVGFWGWCVGPEGDGPWACSETDAWYTMDELLETAAVTSTIPTDAYFVGLMHGIMVHGLAMVATMAATVPAGILIWRRYIRNDRTIGPGLALHATMFAGSVFSFVAFVIDKALQARLGGQTKYPVEQGSVPIMTGTSALLLFLAFIASVAPGIHRRVKRQQEYAGSWEDVHAASELKRSMSVGTTATGLTRSKTWMKRMTGYRGRRR